MVEFAQPEPRCKLCAKVVVNGIERCGECITRPPVLDACVAAVSYDYPWAALVSQFKFNDNPGFATMFAVLMRSIPWVEPALEQADLVVPMPLSAQRLRTRGFNQALVLARALEPEHLDHRVLLRIKDTPPQSLLDRAERLRAVTGAFAVDPFLAHRIAGKRIVLIDDVMTSGASLNAAAKALKSASAAHVTGLVFARTENH